MNKEYWNIVKGIGIVAVVVGHCCMPTVRFMYLFHLPLFFFVTGYLYNEEKYGDKPYVHVATKLKSSWIKYVVIYWIAILLHNVLLKLNMLSEGATSYSLKDTATHMANAVFGIGYEPFVVTLWFVPVVVVAGCLLGFIVSFSRKLHQWTSRKEVKYGFQMLIVLGLSALGYYLEKNNIGLAAYLEVALLVMLFVWGGYLLRKSQLELKKYLHPVLALVGLIVLYICSKHFWLDMVLHFVYPYMFIVAFVGIYVCLYLAKAIQKSSILRKIFARWGKDSFWIMFLHITIWRVFDWICTVVIFDGDFSYYRGPLPVAFPDLWPLYLLLGLGIPWVVSMVIEYLKTQRKS